MQSESYEPVTQWSTSKQMKTQEGWYNMPGTSVHELNMNVSNAQGPHFGPKGRVSASQKLSSKQGMFLGFGLIVLLIILFLVYHGMKRYRHIGQATYYY